MWKCIVFCVLWLPGLSLGDAEDFKIVCYFASWADRRRGNGKFEISDIDPTRCTHLIYSFVGITENGDIDVLEKSNHMADNGGNDDFRKFVALRNSSLQTKFMVAIGGWGQGSVKFSNVVANPTLRSNFVQNVVNFTLFHGFDGFDVDWEYPNQRNGTKADVENFVLLLKELRAVFDEHHLILSAAVAAEERSISLSYNISGTSEYVHFINLMSYQFHGWWDSTTGHKSPLYPTRRETTARERNRNINASVNYWLNHGAPSKKIILGTAFNGLSFTLSDSNRNVPGSPITGPGEAGEYSRRSGTLLYYEICKRVVNESWTSAWDKEQRVSYAYLGNQWISYDSVQSITGKANYIKERGLGGAMIWSIDMDDFRGTCGERNPLLKALNIALRRNSRDK